MRYRIFTAAAVSAVTIMCASVASSDETTTAYQAALDAGDAQMVYETASYVEPPYCYDLNRWHGVTFTKAVNGRCITPAYPFIYQDMNHLKVRKLYERAGIGEMIASSDSELELIGKLSDWANSHWGHMQPLPYPTWDANEILDKAETGDAFWCTFKAALFVQACNAAGLTARILGINPRGEAAHTVTEVYNNELRKWMLVDPWMNCYFERNGVPLSALEFHDARDDYAGIVGVFGANGKGLEYWDRKTGKSDTIPTANKRVPIEDVDNHFLINMYYDIRIVMRNDHTVHPQSTENVYVDGFMVPYNPRGGEWWGPQLKWADDETVPQITCRNTSNYNDFEWPLNEVEVDLALISPNGAPAVLEARLRTLTPSFDHYRLVVDGIETAIDGDVHVWALREGTNSLRVSAVNATGRPGFTSEFELEYDPSVTNDPAPVTVTIPNPGMEDKAEKGEGPAQWSTITSNSLRSGIFIRDRKEHHSGSYSLKAKPAQGDDGTEYAFIVKTAKFKTNPSTDVIYSIWLKANKDDTPVDIALLESTYKGHGTYVERVIVGRKWRKYELRCRLHNNLTDAYTGFKVYTGTVWADDAAIEEVGGIRGTKITGR